MFPQTLTLTAFIAQNKVCFSTVVDYDKLQLQFCKARNKYNLCSCIKH